MSEESAENLELDAASSAASLPVVKPPNRSRHFGKGKVPRKVDADGLPALLRRQAGQYRVRLSALPKAVAAIRKHGSAMRDALEAACVNRWGGISFPQSMIVQSIIRIEENIRIDERLLRDGWDDLGIRERADILDKINRLSQQRDNHLAKLDLDGGGKTSDPFSVLDVTATTPTEDLPHE